VNQFRKFSGIWSRKTIHWPSQQIEPQVTFAGAYQDSGATVSERLAHDLDLSQQHIISATSFIPHLT
jgi:hypothetical protein